MNKSNLFGRLKIRSSFVEEHNDFYYSINDILESFSDTTTPVEDFQKLQEEILVSDGISFDAIVEINEDTDNSYQAINSFDTLLLLPFLHSPLLRPYRYFLTETGATKLLLTRKPELLVRYLYDEILESKKSKEWIEMQLRKNDEWVELNEIVQEDNQLSKSSIKLIRNYIHQEISASDNTDTNPNQNGNLINASSDVLLSVETLTLALIISKIKNAKDLTEDYVYDNLLTIIDTVKFLLATLNFKL